jgi:hypothetical protein
METKIADNFIYESVLDREISDSNNTPFVKKNLNYVLDQQAGNSSYTSGQVIIDSSSLAATGNTFQDWSNAYIVLPYNVKLEMNAVQASASSGPSAATANMLNFLTSSKNFSLIDSITIEQNGRTIVSQTSNLSQLVNFKAHSTFSQDFVAKMGASLGYTPDSVGNWTYSGSTLQIDNTDNLYTNTAFKTAENYNSGLLARQQKFAPISSTLTTQTKQIAEGDNVQLGTAVVPTTTAGNVILSDHHFLATIRLKDLSDYFDKHPKLTRGVAYKIYLRINQGVTTFSHEAPTAAASAIGALSITAQSFSGIGGSLVQPSMVHVGPGTLSTLLTYPNALTITADSLKLTSVVDVGSNALLNGVRLYVPSYDCAPEAASKLMRQPSIKAPFFDIYSNVIQSQAAGSYINAQIASGISSPKALIVVPQIAQSVNSINQQASALDPCPATTMPQASLTNTQIKVGSEYILPDRVNYDFIQYCENNAQLFGLNGNQRNDMSSGIVDFQKWRNNYRYYAYDLSRYLDSMDNLPRMITFESFNNSGVALDLYIYVLWERNAEFDLANGTLSTE